MFFSNTAVPEGFFQQLNPVPMKKSMNLSMEMFISFCFNIFVSFTKSGTFITVFKNSGNYWNLCFIPVFDGSALKYDVWDNFLDTSH